MIKDKIIKHKKVKYYLIGTLRYNGMKYELYENMLYGEDAIQLIVNSDTKKAIGFTYNGFEELRENEYIETVEKEYTII